ADAYTAVAIQSDGKLVVCGMAKSVTGYLPNGLCVSRIFANGSGIDGTLNRTDTVGTSALFALNDVVIQSDGKIVIGASYRGDLNKDKTAWLLARYNANGTDDNSFGAN